MINKNRMKIDFIIKAFDVLFIMILCFLTLLTTMILRGSVIVGSTSNISMKYSFNIVFFLITFISLILYLFYIITHSNKELRNMINEIYSNNEGQLFNTKDVAGIGGIK